MLKTWIKDFPTFFVPAAEYEVMPPQEQSKLARILEQAQQLNYFSKAKPQNIENILAVNEAQIDALLQVANTLSENELLDVDKFTNLVKAHEHLSNIDDMLAPCLDLEVADRKLALSHITSHPYPSLSASLIIKLHKAGQPIKSAIALVDSIDDLSGVEAAIEIYDASEFPYRAEHFAKFRGLASVLSSPLARTIFNARLRTSSDYGQSNNEIGKPQAREIISMMTDAVEPEDMLRAFFNYWSPYRAGGTASLKYYDECAVDIDEVVESFITDYLINFIEKANDFKAYQAAKQRVKHICKKGVGDDILNIIKYEVANHVVSVDWYNTDEYESLIESITKAGAALTMSEGTFSKAFKNCPGAPKMVTHAMARHGLMPDASASASASQHVEKADTEVAKTTAPVAF